MGFVDDVLGTNIFGDNSTDRAIDAQTDATRAAMSEQRQMYDQMREDQQPWRDAGQGALGALLGQMGIGNATFGSGDVGHGAIKYGGSDKFRNNQGLMTGGGNLMREFSMDDFREDPGYQFRLSEGQKAIERGAAARGGLNSARTMKALMGYGQNMASQEYQNAYNRYNQNQSNKFNRLASIAGLGQTANQQLGNASMNYGNQMSNLHTGMGNAIAAANMGQSNMIGGLLGQTAMGVGSAGGLGAFFSDINLKDDIKPIPVEDIQEFKASIKPYYYKFKDMRRGEGQWAGFMAQDIEKTKLGKLAVFEDKKGNKKVDSNKLVSILIASLAEEAA